MNVFVGMECSGTIREAFRRRGHNAWSCDRKPDALDSQFHIRGDVFEVLNPKGPYADAWDLAIFHPDCTYLSSSGFHWCYRDPTEFPNTVCGPARLEQAEQAEQAFMRCVNSGKEFGIKRVIVENPVGVMSTRYRRPSQIIQPWQYGDDASKATGLWLEGEATFLFPTKFCAPRMVCQTCWFTHPWLWGVRKSSSSFRERCPKCSLGKMLPRWDNQTDTGQNKLAPSETRAAERAVTYPGPADAMAEQWGALDV